VGVGDGRVERTLGERNRWVLVGTNVDELAVKLKSGDELAYAEVLQLAEGASLDASDLNLMVNEEFSLDEDSESIPDFQRLLHIACLQQNAITEELVSQILENALDDGDPEDVFPYWWEVIELSIDSKKLSTELISRLLTEILLNDYEDEILPEMQLCLIEKLTADFDVPDEFTKKIKNVTKNLRSSID
jgi:hypothetical protein